MASITVRNIDDSLKKRLRIQAAKHGRSMEEEVRNILKSALSVEEESGENLADFIRSRIEPIGGVDLPKIPREPVREPENFDE
jgi:plasmid stability protein